MLFACASTHFLSSLFSPTPPQAIAPFQNRRCAGQLRQMQLAAQGRRWQIAGVLPRRPVAGLAAAGVEHTPAVLAVAAAEGGQAPLQARGRTGVQPPSPASGVTRG
jgi:hypothetical protein